MYRGGRSRQWLAVAGVVVLVVGVILGIIWLGGSSEPSKADAGTLQASNQPTAGKNTRPADPGKSSLASGAEPRNQAVQPTESKPPQQRISMGGPPATPAAAVATEAKAPPQTPSATAQKPATPGASDAAPGSAAPSTPDDKVREDAPAVVANTPANKPANAPQATTTSDSGTQQQIDLGLQLIKQNKPIEARRMLTDALLSSGVSAADADRVRAELSTLNQRLVFSPEVIAGDPFASSYQIQSGESLAKLPRKLGLVVDWRFLQRINRVHDPARLQVNQRIKVIKGPFHAVVHKRAFRLDLYLGEGSDRVFVASYPVGLGEYGATPEGEFIVKTNSKLENPAWTNPRTGEHFAADDTKNPLGEYWIGLVGLSDNIRGLEGYGLHGTIEKDSIGQERSMGCVRMLADDIRLMYEVLMEKVSHVEIHGPDWP
jgi:hypothetical protein